MFRGLVGQGCGGGQQVGQGLVGSVGVGAQGGDKIAEVDAVAGVDQSSDLGHGGGQSWGVGVLGLVAKFGTERAQRVGAAVGVVGEVDEECGGEAVGALLG